MREIALDIDEPLDAPLTLEELKTGVRIAHTDLDEQLVTNYLPAAVQRAEDFMRRSIVTREHRWIIDCLPYCGPLYLPRGYVTAVSKVEISVNGAYVTLTGPTSTTPGSDYQEDLRGRPRIMPPRLGGWPWVADIDVPAPIVVTFTAGWPADSVPAAIRWAVIASVDMALNGDETDLPERLVSAYCLRA